MLRLLCSLALLAAAAAALTTSTQTDQQRLLAQKDAILNWAGYVEAQNISGWVEDNSVPVCLWTGITCNPEGRIISTVLQCPSCEVKAIGTLAPDVSQILPLQTLNLQQQKLSGTLPAEYGRNGTFPNLINLLLQQNHVTGRIPETWSSPGAFPKMTLLTLHVNNLTGPLPQPESWPVIQILRMQSNQLSGPLPGSWAAAMPMLQILSLHNNRLTGPLPPAWAPVDAFPELQELYLQNNRLKGTIPSGQAAVKFSKLRILDISYNDFQGSLPDEWGLPEAGPTLELLYLRSVNLSGPLPSAWGNPGHGLNKLRQLWLDGNDLSGTVPASWSDLKDLEQVYVRPGNLRLCGPVPAGLPFKLCDASGNSECNVTAKLDGLSCPPWVEPDGPDYSSTNTGAIVGGVVGGVAGGALLAVLIVFLVRRHRRRKQRMSPFIAEAHDTLDPAHNDMSGYAKVLESLEGGDPERPPPRACGSRMFGRVSQMLGHTGSAGSSPSLPPPPPPPLTTLPRTSSGAAPAAPTTAGADSSPSAPSKEPSGSMPSSLAGRPDILMFNESALLPSLGMSGVLPNLTPAGSARGAGTGGRTSRMSYASKHSEDLGDVWEDGMNQLNDWEIRPEEIEYMKRPDGSDWELGCGGFGKVYKALRNGAQPVAVKVLMSGSETRYMAMNDFRREVAILKSCRDPNIVAFLGACMREDCAMLVTEYCEGGNLARNIVAHKVSWYRRGRKIAIDIAKGLVFLHSRRIVHLDIKSPNVLLSRDGTAKVADVGLAKIIAQEYSAVTGAVGTLAWSSPEMLLGARCTERSDIYSYGVVLWEIATGQTPIRGQLRDVKVPEECPDELRKLMLDCLEQNPRRRPSSQQLIERLRKIPVSPLEHAPALPPQTMRPDTPVEAAAAAAARAKAAAAQAQMAAHAAVAAADQAAADRVQVQQQQQHVRGQQQRRQQQQQQQQQQQATPERLAPVSAFAAAAATAASATPRTASNASELLQTRMDSGMAIPASGAFASSAIAPAGSWPTPFSNTTHADARSDKSSGGRQEQLLNWNSSGELGSRDPGSSLDMTRANTLSRGASAVVPAVVPGLPPLPPLHPAPPPRRTSISMPPSSAAARQSPFASAASASQSLPPSPPPEP